MKKLVSSLLACTVVACSLFSCGSSSGSDDKKEKKESKKEPKAAELLVGKWKMDDLKTQGIDSGGLMFTADGKGGIYEDTSSLLHFVDDGLEIGFEENKTVISKEYFTEDGDKLTIDVLGKKMLVMTKLEAKDGYDGKYALDGGILFDTIKQGIEGKGLDGNKALNININFEGEKSEVLFNDLFTYTVDGSKLTVAGFAGFLESDKDEVSADFTIDGDKLTIKDSEKETVLTRVE